MIKFLPDPAAHIFLQIQDNIFFLQIQDNIFIQGGVFDKVKIINHIQIWLSVFKSSSVHEVKIASTSVRGCGGGASGGADDVDGKGSNNYPMTLQMFSRAGAGRYLTMFKFQTHSDAQIFLQIQQNMFLEEGYLTRTDFHPHSDMVISLQIQFSS